MSKFQEYSEVIEKQKNWKKRYKINYQRFTEDRKIFKIIINVLTETNTPIFNLATVIENTIKNTWSLKFNLKQLNFIFEDFLDHSIEEDWDLTMEKGKFEKTEFIKILNKMCNYYNLENNIFFENGK